MHPSAGELMVLVIATWPPTADIEAVEIILTLPDGKISTISMAATKKGNAAECGIPATGDKKT